MRVPRRLARVGAAADLPNATAFDAYVGPSGEITVDHLRGIIALHDGVTAGGLQFTPASEGGAASVAMRRGYISGLKLSNSVTTPATQLDIAEGVAASDDAAMLMDLAASTLNCATVGANGLDAGALAANTWYHVFAIARPDETTAKLASLSPTSPTLPSGFTKKRRIGSFKTNGSSQIIAFRQLGNVFLWDVPVNDYIQVNPGTAQVFAALSVPAGVQVTAIHWFYLNSNEAVRRCALITSPDQANTAPDVGTMSSIAAGSATAAGTCQGEFRTRTNTSRQIRFRLDTSSANANVLITTNGWIDDL